MPAGPLIPNGSPMRCPDPSVQAEPIAEISIFYIYHIGIFSPEGNQSLMWGAQR